jgi:hypothetical protein
MRTGIFCGGIVGVVVGGCYFVLLNDDRHANSNVNNLVASLFCVLSPRFSHRQVDQYNLGGILTLLWSLCLLLLYVVVWLAPNRGCFARRPAVIYWASFWAFERTVLFFAVMMESSGIDAGFCMYHANALINFAVLKLWVAYRVSVMEAKFWYCLSALSLAVFSKANHASLASQARSRPRTS